MTAPRFSDALGHGMSDKRIDILRGIGRTGSISQAAREARVSYKAAWQAIATLTNLAGVPLVQRSVGGAGGGGAVLTEEGRQLLVLADAHEVARRAVQPGGTASTAMARLSIRTSMRNQLPATVSALERAGRVVRVRMSLPGGDAQIAELVLDRRCELVIFFEDPHVARQHEADIQLLERAVCAATHDTTCFNSPATAERWAAAIAP